MTITRVAQRARPARLPLNRRLFAALADGQWRTGTELADRHGVTRAAVWKAVRALRTLGLPVEAHASQGYRLPHAITPLDAATILAAIEPAQRTPIRRGEVLWSVASTNASLLRRTDLPVGRGDFLLAEYQTAGRGRQARRWHAAPGDTICLSLGWNYAALPRDAGALSLAAGVAVLRVLRRAGLHRPQLKWPNDLVVDGGKLGGILTELRAETGGTAQVVIGVGLNVAVSDALRAQILASGTQPVSLSDLGLQADRNAVAGALVGELVRALLLFERTGLQSFADEWTRADALLDRAVDVHGATRTMSGIAAGIDADGALRVRTAHGVQRFLSGDVSVRAHS
jgi:BirA family biotin operon repressor/biotin-[acetyl-CoA-carboxylase] ligase